MARRIDLRSRMESNGAGSAQLDPKLAQAVIQRREQQLEQWVSRSPEHPASGTDLFQGRLAEARVRQEAEAAATGRPPGSSAGSASTTAPSDLIVERQDQSTPDHRSAGVVREAAGIGQPHRVMGICAIRHVSLSVGDLDRSAAWYASTLGCGQRFREDSEDRKACVMTFPGGDCTLGLVEHARSSQDGLDMRPHGLDHVAFTVASREALQQWATNLSAAGVDHSGVVEAPRGAILSFNDPDGTSLALFWDRS